MRTRMQYLIRGRSEDGTMYFEGHSSWGSSSRYAKRYASVEAAQAVIDAREPSDWLFQVRVAVAPRRRYGLKRKEKREYRKSVECFDQNAALFEAYENGRAFAMGMDLPPRLKRNPYPPGRRHDAWETGRSRQ